MMKKDIISIILSYINCNINTRLMRIYNDIQLLNIVNSHEYKIELSNEYNYYTYSENILRNNIYYHKLYIIYYTNRGINEYIYVLTIDDILVCEIHSCNILSKYIMTSYTIKNNTWLQNNDATLPIINNIHARLYHMLFL